ncbi:uncharacterized protein LOC106164812 [Lingula anatina]|uniref:Uncharacterized protein LOC106164812 n=1 Tax=Lingula anatina TaxID=7574 RepID=A0A1S3IL97_LINAN|nr:uncharacterized protein LOC106164812 [Lingula anatina]|eukprot:XP_013398294.1 uncharacterized protein LOC106164812 [Lingula anatina]
MIYLYLPTKMNPMSVCSVCLLSLVVTISSTWLMGVEGQSSWYSNPNFIQSGNSGVVLKERQPASAISSQNAAMYVPQQRYSSATFSGFPIPDRYHFLGNPSPGVVNILLDYRGPPPSVVVVDPQRSLSTGWSGPKDNGYRYGIPPHLPSRVPFGYFSRMPPVQIIRPYYDFYNDRPAVVLKSPTRSAVTY